MRSLQVLSLVLLMLLSAAAPWSVGAQGNQIIKSGTYFLYVARTNESVNESSLLSALGSANMFFSLRRNGEPVFVSVYGNGSVEFRVLGVENGTATVSLVVSGTDAVITYAGEHHTLLVRERCHLLHGLWKRDPGRGSLVRTR